MAKKQKDNEDTTEATENLVSTETIKMVRDGFFADVHHDEVENYSKVGFSVVE